MNDKGFTLVEILVAVMIVVLLVTMAAPMYEKAIEKSRLAEARVTAKKMLDSKARLMDSMDIDTFNVTSPQFGFENLDFGVNCKNTVSSNGHTVRCSTKDFIFYINPSGAANGICARRIGEGDTSGVNFLYMGEFASGDDDVFQCNDGGNGGA